MAIAMAVKKNKFKRVVCSHYDKKGHTKETCYTLIGHPPDFKFRKQKGLVIKGYGNQMSQVNAVNKNPQPHLHMSKQQVTKLMAFLNSDEPGTSENRSVTSFTMTDGVILAQSNQADSATLDGLYASDASLLSPLDLSMIDGADTGSIDVHEVLEVVVQPFEEEY